MSERKPTVQVLRAPSIDEGLQEFVETKLEGKSEESRCSIIALLNERFPQGVTDKTRGFMLPNDFDMAKATLRHLRDDRPGHCFKEHGWIIPTSKLLNPEVNKYSYFLFCHEAQSWYRVTSDSPILQVAA